MSAVELQGRWGGDQLQLEMDEAGGRVQMDCAGGHFAGPIKLDAANRFVAQGTFEAQGGGPQRADAVAPNARYTGEITAGVMRLTILPEGAGAAQTYTLRKGVNVKLFRCL